MKDDLNKWAKAVKEKMKSSNVNNVAFAIEIKNNQKHAVIINPFEVSEEENLLNLKSYCEAKEVIAMVWAYRQEGQLVFYENILNEGFIKQAA